MPQPHTWSATRLEVLPSRFQHFSHHSSGVNLHCKSVGQSAGLLLASSPLCPFFLSLSCSSFLFSHSFFFSIAFPSLLQQRRFTSNSPLPHGIGGVWGHSYQVSYLVGCGAKVLSFTPQSPKPWLGFNSTSSKMVYFSGFSCSLRCLPVSSLALLI